MQRLGWLVHTLFMFYLFKLKSQLLHVAAKSEMTCFSKAVLH